MMFEDKDAPEEATFPLLGLPNHLIKKVINQMSIFKIFGFSLISKRTCKLVSETHKTSYAPAISIGNTIYLDFDRWTRFSFQPTHQEIDQSPVQEIKMTGPVNNWTGSKNYIKEGFTMKDWVRHVFKAFNCSYETAHLEWQEDSERYSVASVKRSDRLTINIMTINIMNPQFEEVTGTFLVESIELSGNSYHDDDLFIQGFQKILIQNFSYTSLDHEPSFDTILMTNSKCFDVSSSLYFTDKEANRFLKLWARGAMPNLEHFPCSVRRNNQSVEEITEKVFRGIKHNWAVEQLECHVCETERDGGFVIHRVGGTRAMVDLHAEYSDEYLLFDMFVEH